MSSYSNGNHPESDDEKERKKFIDKPNNFYNMIEQEINITKKGLPSP